MTTHAPAAPIANVDPDATPVPRVALVPGTNRVDPGLAALDAIKGLEESLGLRLDGLAKNVDNLQAHRREDKAAATRRHDAVMSALSTVLSRVDTNEAVTEALSTAIGQVHIHASEARRDVEALGTQVGKSTAELAAADATHRGVLTSLVEHDEQQDQKIDEAARIARHARRVAAIRYGGIVVGTVALWELLQRIYPLLHH